MTFKFGLEVTSTLNWHLTLNWPWLWPWNDLDLWPSNYIDLDLEMTLTLKWPWPLTLKWPWPLTWNDLDLETTLTLNHFCIENMKNHNLRFIIRTLQSCSSASFISGYELKCNCHVINSQLSSFLFSPPTHQEGLEIGMGTLK